MTQSDNVREIQNASLDIFKEFKRICDENNLRFFAIGGTCIGAVRHKGFIPWDDDIDVAMPYEDICKFREIIKNKHQWQYSLYDPEEKKHYCFNLLKLQNDDTTFVEGGMLDYPESYFGIFIDIMPIFGLPAEPERRKILRRYDFYTRMNPKMRRPFKDMITIKPKIAWILNSWRRWIYPFHYFTGKINAMLGQFPLETSDKIIFGWRRLKGKADLKLDNRCIFDYEDFSDFISVPFEDTFMRIPKGYDNYLKTEFGNYMKLPPKEKQVGGHSKEILDFQKSYKEYAKERTQK